MSRDDEPADRTPIRVEILYFTGCPNHDGLADRIQQLLTDHRFPAASSKSASTPTTTRSD